MKSYIDDTTPYFVSAKNNKEVVKVLENTSVNMLSWFAYNGMKANQDKRHFLPSTKETCITIIGNHNIENSKK